VLRPRYGGAIRVYERQKSGRIHYHLLVNVGVDIRTGFDFGAIKKHDYRSASAALRNEWAFWRRTAKEYRFGRTELLPVISTSEAVGRYVGKYISKHLAAREERDLGVRLVSYIGPRVASVKFAWAGGKGRDWRDGLGALIKDLYESKQIHRPTMEAMALRYGSSWAWKWKEVVRDRAAAIGVDVSTGEIKTGEPSEDSLCDGASRLDASMRVRASRPGEAGHARVDRRQVEIPRGRVPRGELQAMPSSAREIFATSSRADFSVSAVSRSRGGASSSLTTSTYVDSERVERVEMRNLEAERKSPPPRRPDLSSRRRSGTLVL
jgi:nucleotide-binding universal stress UspA family protein